MVLGTPASQHPIVVNKETVEIADRFKYLGLTKDNHLTFDHHTTDIQKRSNQRLSVICKLKGLNVAPISSYC